MQRLIKSSKFQAVLVDAGLSSLVIVLAWFLKPEQMDQAIMLIGIWQPVFLAYIAGVAYEDGQSNRATIVMQDTRTDDTSRLHEIEA
jgi:hypothetical protein